MTLFVTIVSVQESAKGKGAAQGIKCRQSFYPSALLVTVSMTWRRFNRFFDIEDTYAVQSGEQAIDRPLESGTVYLVQMFCFLFTF
jgi:hypothetical protein